jgi:hypothetical protein
MLALSQTSSGSLIAVISITAVALGVLVAMTVPVPRRTPVVVARSTVDEPVPASTAPVPSVVLSSRQVVLTTTVLAALSCRPCL